MSESLDVGAAKNAVGAAFVLAGLLLSSLIARVPDLRADLGLDNADLGLLLLTLAVGSLITMPATGMLVARLGAARVVRVGSVVAVTGILVAAVGAAGPASVPMTVVGLVLLGVGVSLWDVAMNVEGAEVERRLGRTVMPRFHAGYSFGSVGGAVIGVVVTLAGVPLPVHLAVVAAVAGGTVWIAVDRFLEVEPVAHTEVALRRGSAWTEPRTLLVGLMVLTFAVAEGSANDWLSLALIDGYDVPHWAGIAGYALFVTAMTAGRLVGPALLDRAGRVPALLTSAVLVGLGLVMVVHGQVGVLVGLGIVVWGLGAALGFPVGMSAAADDPRRAPARVSVVSTIGYTAFLAGPPLLGRLGDSVGTLASLQAVAGLMVVALLVVPASRAPDGTTTH